MALSAVAFATPSHKARHSIPDTSFLEFLFGDTEGFLEIGFIHGDPDAKPRPPLRFRDRKGAKRWWYYSRANASRIAAYLNRLGVDYGNVYLSRTLYDRQARPSDGGIPKPSRIIFLDADKKIQQDRALTGFVRTNDGRGHGYILLSEDADASTIEDISRRAARALGTDASGSDIEQLVRWPGSRNTKRGANFPVTQVYLDGPTYSINELQIAFPPVDRSDVDNTYNASSDDAEVDGWRGRIRDLIGPNGVPRRLTNPNHQAYQILTGKKVPLKPDRTPDASMMRAYLINGLIAYCYPDSEIMAIALYYGNFSVDSHKDADDIRRDVANLIRKYRPKYKDRVPVPSTYSSAHTKQSANDRPPTKRARKDRPHLIDADGLLAYYQQNLDAGNTVLQSRKDVAAANRISLPTLDRLERQLRDRGLIARQTNTARTLSWVEVLGTINIEEAMDDAPEEAAQTTTEIADQGSMKVLSGLPAETAIQPIPLPQNAPSCAHDGVTPAPHAAEAIGQDDGLMGNASGNLEPDSPAAVGSDNAWHPESMAMPIGDGVESDDAGSSYPALYDTPSPSQAASNVAGRDADGRHAADVPGVPVKANGDIEAPFEAGGTDAFPIGMDGQLASGNITTPAPETTLPEAAPTNADAFGQPGIDSGSLADGTIGAVRTDPHPSVRAEGQIHDGAVEDVALPRIDDAMWAVMANLDMAGRRVTFQRCKGMIDTYFAHAWSDAALQYRFKKLQLRRSWQRAAERDLQRMRRMSVSELQRLADRAGDHIADSYQQGDDSHRFWIRYRGTLLAEIERRKARSHRARRVSPELSGSGNQRRQTANASTQGVGGNGGGSVANGTGDTARTQRHSVLQPTEHQHIDEPSVRAVPSGQLVEEPRPQNEPKAQQEPQPSHRINTPFQQFDAMWEELQRYQAAVLEERGEHERAAKLRATIRGNR